LVIPWILLKGEEERAKAAARPFLRSPKGICLATSVGRSSHHGRDLGEDRADGCGNARHDRTGGHGDEAGHQRVFDEVLTAGILHHFQFEQ